MAVGAAMSLDHHDCLLGALPDRADGNAGANRNTDANIHAYAHVDSHCNPYADSNPNPDPYANT